MMETNINDAKESRGMDIGLDDQRTLPRTENGLYLARTVGPVLTRALAEVVIQKPTDPIGFLSDWLHKLAAEQQKKMIEKPNPNLRS